jgi:hypothetical protein
MDKKLEAVIVLGGWLFREPDGHWRTMNFGELDGEGLESGDRVRVVAAAFLAKADPSLKIIVSGSKGRLDHVDDCPTLASVLKKELTDLTISPENIIEEDRSTGTLDQLRKSLAIIKKLKFSGIGIISNRYHLPRVGAFLERMPDINWPGLKFISAEEIAIKNDPESWEAEIKTAYASAGMKKRIAMEQNGIKDLREGKYRL